MNETGHLLRDARVDQAIDFGMAVRGGDEFNAHVRAMMKDEDSDG